jgi:hypothetical protein
MFLQPGVSVYSTVYEVLATEPQLSVFRQLVDVVPGMRATLSDPDALITLLPRMYRVPCHSARCHGRTGGKMLWWSTDSLPAESIVVLQPSTRPLYLSCACEG